MKLTLAHGHLFMDNNVFTKISLALAQWLDDRPDSGPTGIQWRGGGVPVV